MAAAKINKVTIKQTVVILRDKEQVTLNPGDHEVSASELKILTDAGLVSQPETEEADPEKAAE